VQHASENSLTMWTMRMRSTMIPAGDVATARPASPYRHWHAFSDGSASRQAALLRYWLSLVPRCLAALFLLCAASAFAKVDFLDPSEAFRLTARMADSGMLEVHYEIADGYYLYRERFKFAVEPAGAVLGEAQFPKGVIKYDETFKKNVETYRHDVTVRIPVTTKEPFALLSTSQGCADAGLCYPPQTARTSFSVGGTSLPAAPTVTSPAPPVSAAAAPPRGTPTAGMRGGATTSSSEMSRFEEALGSGNMLFIAIVFIGAGLGLAFTPCVLPMLPILSSIIAEDARATPENPAGHDTEGALMSADSTRGRRSTLDRARGFFLALAYSLGMALVYTSLGVMAGLAGEGLAATLQKPEVLYSFAAILVLLSLSMFDFYQLQMPHFIQVRLTTACGRIGGGRLLGVFIMGAISALIVGPCVAAPLAAILITISRTRDVWIGGSALFFMAVGMSIPLLILGVSEGALLPRAGKWMEGVKRFFGVALIAVAIWMIEPVAPPWVEMLAFAGLFVITSVYMHAFDPLPPSATGWSRFWKGVGVLLLLAGAVQVVGVATGGRDLLQPLSHLAMRGAGDPAGKPPLLTFQKVHTTDELDARLQNPGKPVMLAFSAEWCTSCKELERITFTDRRVVHRLNDFVLLEADVTDVTAADKVLLKRFNLFGPPGVLFFDTSGHPLPEATVIGFEGAESFLASLAKVSS
jgi:thiol:disulfide interchange protein DsbD